MRSLVISLSVLLPITFATAGCGGDDGGEEAFDTLQDCFDDHTSTSGEGLPIQQAITVCCLEHPIAGKAPSCGATAAECNTIVRAGLSAATTTADIMAACTDYQTQLGM